ncbi:septum formation family protein, partial [Actinophytocola sp.]|uniref:septum formation family protein n=1 Tax=Actinophytocola sp. TaxID=1872138 RepID=UPI002D806660
GHPNLTARMAGPLPGKPTRSRRWWAIAAAVLLVLAAFTGGWFAHVGFADATKEVEAANGGVLDYGEQGAVPQFKLSDGYCAAAELKPGVRIPSQSSCDEPHAIQVFGVNTVLGKTSDVDPDYPSRERLSAYGQAWCSMVFASKFLPSEDKATQLSFVTLVPTEEEWKDAERQSKAPVICVLRARDNSQLTKSMIVGN